jgi:hypothetical protein
MWVLIVITFGFVSTDKVIFQEFDTEQKCLDAKAAIVKMDAQWKKINVPPPELRDARNLAPKAECVPK